ncbi:MAG: hypothetical protein CSB49_07800 [Proteobacteria bacterium]|nr:MAG: hypothetical protein CSB49_07800 [Pseudomonadota bacterium]
MEHRLFSHIAHN